MPLSEREQRILEEIEKDLYKQDPRFAKEVQRNAPRAEDRRRVKVGVATFFAGFALLIGFFVSGSIIIGVVAFGTMVAGIVTVAGSLIGSLAPRRPPGPGIAERTRGAVKNVEDKVRKRYRGRN